MKKIILMVTLLSHFLMAVDLKVSSSYEQAIQKANNEKKLILLYVYSKTCSWCLKMEETTLKNKKVINFVNNNFVFVQQNKHLKNYPKKLFYPRFTPTTYVIDPSNNDEIYALYGYKTTNSFLEELWEYK